MEAMREAWTDVRLDELNRKVDDGFRHVDSRFDAAQARADSRFDAMQAHVDQRFDSLDKRFDGLQRTMTLAVLALSSAFIAGFAALVGLVATQL